MLLRNQEIVKGYNGKYLWSTKDDVYEVVRQVSGTSVEIRRVGTDKVQRQLVENLKRYVEREAEPEEPEEPEGGMEDVSPTVIEKRENNQYLVSWKQGGRKLEVVDGGDEYTDFAPKESSSGREKETGMVG